MSVCLCVLVGEGGGDSPLTLGDVLNSLLLTFFSAFPDKLNLAKENLGCEKGNLREENFGFPFPRFFLTLAHSERPKLYTILAFLSAIGLKEDNLCIYFVVVLLFYVHG